MAKGIHRLKGKALDAALKRAGMHGDGAGLYLRVRSGGSAQWIFVSTIGGKRTEIGLGGFLSVNIATAREMADKIRKAIAAGLDPRSVISQSNDAPTFGKVADDLIESLSKEWRNPKHRAQWQTTLSGEYDEKRVRIDAKAHRSHVTALKRMRAMPVDKVETADILAVLKPIWQEAPETASRVRSRLEAVLSAGKAKGHRNGENPAQWRGHLDALLPKPRKLSARGHHAALPYTELTDFMRALRSSESISRLCLEFTILTASRSGEARGATWAEIDLDNAIWTIPASRMKAQKVHRVPLTARMIAILKRMQEIRTGDLVFAGARKDKPLTDAALSKVAKEIGGAITAHGFRSCFRDWAGDKTQFPREVAEAALAHRVGDETERAYRRGDALEKRRALMTAWSEFCEGVSEAKIIQIKR